MIGGQFPLVVPKDVVFGETHGVRNWLTLPSHSLHPSPAYSRLQGWVRVLATSGQLPGPLRYAGIDAESRGTEKQVEPSAPATERLELARWGT
jgi:hypothetical protein